MKTKITTILFWMTVPASVFSQSFTEKITRELTFEKRSAANAIIVANINGDVKVQGYEGDKILLEVTKTVTGKTEARLEKAKKEIQLGDRSRRYIDLLYRRRVQQFWQIQEPSARQP